jgi:hypothetical protein
MARLEILFLLFALVFGIPMIVLIPPGAGYDEEDHLVRVWELSRLSLLPGQMSPREMQYPIAFRDFAYRQQGSSGVIDEEFWQKYGRSSLYADGIVRRELDTKSVYSPALLLPQAIAMRLVRDRLPVLMVLYACRLAGLLSYLLLIWVAIRLIPFGKWLLMILALSPMALFQSATITPDTISNGIGFLFVAGTLRTAHEKGIDWKDVAVLIVLIYLLFLAKLNLIPLVLLPFVLIPPARFIQRRAYVFLPAITLVLFLVEVVGWNLVAAARSNPLLANEADPSAQLSFVMSYPLSFLIVVIRDLMSNGWMYFQTWINGYGYYYWTPPLVVSLLFLFALGAALVFDSSRAQLDRKHRIALVPVFGAAYLATIASLYLTFTPVGSDEVLGVQGRYFVPLALLVLLALPVISWARSPGIASPGWIGGFLALALSLNVVGIFLSFHVRCGSTFYQPELCYQPLSRDFSETRLSPFVAGDTSLAQEIQVACNGFAEVRVLLSPSSGEQGSTRFILRDPHTGQTIIDRSIANTEISGEAWYPLRFDPDWHSGGQRYLLEILAMDTSIRQGPQVLYTTQSEFDLGVLIDNGKPLEEDIVLQYGCATGLRRLWLRAMR